MIKADSSRTKKYSLFSIIFEHVGSFKLGCFTQSFELVNNKCYNFLQFFYIVVIKAVSQAHYCT